MNKKRIGLIIGLIVSGIVLLTIAIPLLVSAKVLAPEQDCVRLIAEEGRGVTICLDILETSLPPTDTPAATNIPTDTPVPPTDTPLPPADTPVPPSATPVIPTSTPVPAGTIEPFAGAPRCLDSNGDGHDDVTDNPYFAWGSIPDNKNRHDLWNEIDGCYYNHEHKANPHDLDYIFGTEFYDIAGGEIGYPWETPDENLNKHEGYNWLIYEDAGLCDSVAVGNCIRAFRIQYHGVFSALGAVVRYHSYAAEIQVCDEATQTCGIVRSGGWADYCGLEIDGTLYPVPDQAALDECPGINTIIKRIHTAGFAPTSTWYNTTLNKAFEGFSIRAESWGPVDPDDPFTTTLYEEGGQNGSYANIHSVSGIITSSDFSGFTDRFGNIVECSTVGLDCIPLEVENAPLGFYHWRDDNPAHVSGPGFRGAGSFFEGDIVFSGPEGIWIEHPN